jgi:hypothetical protein
MVLHFKFIYDFKKLWLLQSKLNISLCFPHTMSFIIFIQMKLNFHKINSFFSSIDRLINTSSAQQHKAQVNLQWVEKSFSTRTFLIHLLKDLWSQSTKCEFHCFLSTKYCITKYVQRDREVLTQCSFRYLYYCSPKHPIYSLEMMKLSSTLLCLLNL